MISREEARLGTLMANLFVVLLLVNFGIQIFVLGPDQVGYNQTWGPLLSATGFAVGFAFLFVIFLGTKLFGGEDNPYVNITGSIAFVAQAVNTIPAFAGVAQENDADAFLTTNQVLDATSGVNSGWGVMIGIFGLVVIRSSLSKQLIPNYGIFAGYGGATLILVSTLGFAYGVLPEALGIVVSVLGGLLLYPLFIFSLGKAFTNSQS
tara:strand:+ start:490 stop:1110 length:621 start_codon:yes stop_codon:yes gene_type:complete